MNDAMVSWTDIAPTVLDWAGVKPPAAISSSPVARVADARAGRGRRTGTWSTASHQFHEVTMYYPMRMVRTRTHKYILNLAHELPSTRPPADL